MTKYVLLITFVLGCTGSEPSEVLDAATEPRSVVVTLSWTYWTSTFACLDEPQCPAEPACASTACSCRVCNTGSCAPNELKLNCCADSLRIDESSLDELMETYPACDLVQTSPETYDLECKWDQAQDLPMTNNSCEWTFSV